LNSPESLAVGIVIEAVDQHENVSEHINETIQVKQPVNSLVIYQWYLNQNEIERDGDEYNE